MWSGSSPRSRRRRALWVRRVGSRRTDSSTRWITAGRERHRLRRSRRAARALVDAGVAALASWGMAGGLDPALARRHHLPAQRSDLAWTARSCRRRVTGASGSPPRLPRSSHSSAASFSAARTPIAAVADKAALSVRPAPWRSIWRVSRSPQVAAAHGLPFIAVRVIVDTAQMRCRGPSWQRAAPGRCRLWRLIGALALAPAELAAAHPARAALSGGEPLAACTLRAQARSRTFAFPAHRRTGVHESAGHRRDGLRRRGGRKGAWCNAGWRGARARARPARTAAILQSLAVEIAVGDLSGRAIRLSARLPIARRCFTSRLTIGSGRATRRSCTATNVEGTRNILTAAARMREWNASSIRAVSPRSVCRRTARRATRTRRSRSTDMIGHYKRSKYLAEELVREAAREGFPVVIVNPSTPIGPGDVKPTPTGQIVLDAACGRTPAYVDTGLNVVHVDDVAAGPSAWRITAGARASATSWGARI